MPLRAAMGVIEGRPGAWLRFPPWRWRPPDDGPYQDPNPNYTAAGHMGVKNMASLSAKSCPAVTTHLDARRG